MLTPWSNLFLKVWSMSDNMTIFVVGSIVVPVVLAVIARIIPKQKAISRGDVS